MQYFNNALYLALMMVVGSSIINADDGNHHPILVNNASNNNIITVGELIPLATDLVLHSQIEFNICNIVNVIIKSFQEASIYDLYNQDKINFHQKLLSNNISILLENKHTMCDLCDELYDVHFRNALHNDINKAKNILQLSLDRLDNNKNKLANNIKIVKDMSQNNKNKLKDYLLQDWKCVFRILNRSTNHWLSQYLRLNAMTFDDNIITEIKNKIQNLILKTLDYFNNEKQCLIDLGINVSELV